MNICKNKMHKLRKYALKAIIQIAHCFMGSLRRSILESAVTHKSGTLISVAILSPSSCEKGHLTRATIAVGLIAGGQVCGYLSSCSSLLPFAL